MEADDGVAVKCDYFFIKFPDRRLWYVNVNYHYVITDLILIMIIVKDGCILI